jgi:hypothetical protein
MVLGDRLRDLVLWTFIGWKRAPSGQCYFVDENGQTGGNVAIDSLPTTPAGCIRLVVISDTHEQHKTINVPNGDILLHAGDVLLFNTFYERDTSLRKLRDFDSWLATLPHNHKLVIGGNHDALFQQLDKLEIQSLMPHATYLEDELWEHRNIPGFRLFASPASKPNRQPPGPNGAFQGHNKTDLRAIAEQIPGVREFSQKHQSQLSSEPISQLISIVYCRGCRYFTDARQSCGLASHPRKVVIVGV